MYVDIIRLSSHHIQDLHLAYKRKNYPDVAQGLSSAKWTFTSTKNMVFNTHTWKKKGILSQWELYFFLNGSLLQTHAMAQAYSSICLGHTFIMGHTCIMPKHVLTYSPPILQPLSPFLSLIVSFTIGKYIILYTIKIRIIHFTRVTGNATLQSEI